jgi:hypothetical protein
MDILTNGFHQGWHAEAMPGIRLVPEVGSSTTFSLKWLKNENRLTHNVPDFLA